MQKEKGFVMLFTVLIISVILALATGIANIGYKQSVLSSVGKDSQVAFSAADAGMECALFYYLTGQLDPSNGLAIRCSGVQLTYSPQENAYVPGPSAPRNDPCFYVSVAPPAPGFETTLRASGYNVCDPTNPRRVERALEVRL